MAPRNVVVAGISTTVEGDTEPPPDTVTELDALLITTFNVSLSCAFSLMLKITYAHNADVGEIDAVPVNVDVPFAAEKLVDVAPNCVSFPA